MPPLASRPHVRLRAALAALLLGVPLAAFTQTLLEGRLITAGGGRSQTPGGCRVVTGSLGEPAAGRSSGGAFTVSAGFWAGPGSADRDVLFTAGFEECT